MKLLPSYEKLRSTGKRIRLHPNGFIQLDLQEDGKKRLHIWPQYSELPRNSKIGVDPIHDHTFGFQSTVIVGMLGNRTYEIKEDPKGTHHVYLVRPFVAVKKSSPLKLKDKTRYNVKLVEFKVFKTGETYSFEPFKFHESVPMAANTLTATIITIADFDPRDQARVLRQASHSKSAPLFKRDWVDPEILWSIVQRVCAMTA